MAAAAITGKLKTVFTTIDSHCGKFETFMVDKAENVMGSLAKHVVPVCIPYAGAMGIFILRGNKVRQAVGVFAISVTATLTIRAVNAGAALAIRSAKSVLSGSQLPSAEISREHILGDIPQNIEEAPVPFERKLSPVHHLKRPWEIAEEREGCASKTQPTLDDFSAQLPSKRSLERITVSPTKTKSYNQFLPIISELDGLYETNKQELSNELFVIEGLLKQDEVSPREFRAIKNWAKQHADPEINAWVLKFNVAAGIAP